MHKSPEIGYMSRFEVLGAIGVTSLILLVAAKFTLYVGQMVLPAVVWPTRAIVRIAAVPVDGVLGATLAGVDGMALSLSAAAAPGVNRMAACAQA